MPLPPDQIFATYPIGIRAVLLFNYENPKGDFIKDVLPYQKESSRLEDIIMERNSKAGMFEKENQLENAIALYEQNISDFTEFPVPYERLRIIYTKRKQYDDAIRACQAYIDMSNQLANAILKEFNNKQLATQLRDAGKFQEQIIKLQRLKNRDANGFVNRSYVQKKSRTIKPIAKSNQWKVVGIILAILFLGFCACIAFGLILNAIGYGK